jgi:hypothetical protein
VVMCIKVRQERYVATLHCHFCRERGGCGMVGGGLRRAQKDRSYGASGIPLRRNLILKQGSKMPSCQLPSYHSPCQALKPLRLAAALPLYGNHTIKLIAHYFPP